MAVRLTQAARDAMAAAVAASATGTSPCQADQGVDEAAVCRACGDVMTGWSSGDTHMGTVAALAVAEEKLAAVRGLAERAVTWQAGFKCPPEDATVAALDVLALLDRGA